MPRYMMMTSLVASGVLAILFGSLGERDGGGGITGGALGLLHLREPGRLLALSPVAVIDRAWPISISIAM